MFSHICLILSAVPFYQSCQAYLFSSRSAYPHYTLFIGIVNPQTLGKIYNAKVYVTSLGAKDNSQNLISAVSDRDVVNLFYGFLSGPENLQDEFDGKEVTHALQNFAEF